MNDIDRVGDRAEEYFAGGLNCCEGCLKAVSESMGVACDCIPSIATGMGGGVGHTGHICGAVTGAAMAIGLAVPAMTLRNHTAEKNWANAVVTELVEAFNHELGHTRCSDLIPVNFADADWRDDYAANNCKQQCCRFVNFAADWAARRLAQEGC
jgi:C_GCAxxG_C_C family probable redox protein